jgi:sugar O-acyltransferase (sialic acid O-acetyltransferase NeuD family)
VTARILADAGHTVVALVDRDPSVTSPLAGVQVMAPDDVEAWVRARSQSASYVVAIGGTLGRDRLAVASLLEGLGLQPLSVVHERAWVDSTATIGAGSQICAMAAVGVDVTIGRQSIVNTNASVDHQSILGDGVHIMPGATVAGEVTIGSGATIGSNATVLPRLEIGEDAVVGAGAVVTGSVPCGTTVIGSPARAT